MCVCVKWFCEMCVCVKCFVRFVCVCVKCFCEICLFVLNGFVKCVFVLNVL